MTSATCAVTQAYEEYLSFTEERLCGRCLPCLTAAPLIIDIFRRLRQGGATPADVDQLEKICTEVFITALCKHGQKAVEKISRAIGDYRAVFETHARDKRCPEHSCEKLLQYTVNPGRCTGCGKCRDICPAGAIIGQTFIPFRTDNHPYVIIGSRCTRCGLCLTVCEEKAIEVA